MKQIGREEHLKKIIARNRNFRRLFLDDNNQVKDEAKDFFEWLNRFCFMNRPTYLMNPKTGNVDPLATHIAEARREVALNIYELIDVNSDRLTRQLTNLQQEEEHDDDR